MKSSRQVLHILSGDLWAGKEYQVVAALTGAKELGQSPSILLFNDNETAQRCRKLGINVYVIDEKRGFVSLICEALKLPAAHTVVVHGYKEAFIGLILSFRRRCKIITVHHGRPENIDRFVPSFYQQLFIWISRLFSSTVVFVSDELRRGLGFANTKKAVVIHNGLMSMPDAGPVADSEAGHIVIVGRLVSVKRVDLAIAAFHKVSPKLPNEIKLLIVGDGPEREKLEALVRARNSADRIQFIGFRSNAENLIASAKALLITSDNEGIPTVLLEAMRAGTPVVSTAVGGIVEVAKMLPGYPIVLVNRGDVEALSEGIYRMSSVVCDKETFDTNYFSPKRIAGDYDKII